MIRGKSDLTWKAAVELGSSVLMGIAAIALLITLYRGPAAARPTGQDVVGLQIAAAELGIVEGSSPLVVAEFSDFECPACNTYATASFPAIEKNFVATGKIRYATFSFPLEEVHPLARKAAEASKCAGTQGRYWDMHRRLFAIAPDLAVDRIVAEASSLGLDGESFVSCLNDGDADAVQADLSVGRRLGVSGTPTFFIGLMTPDGNVQLKKRFVGVMSPELLGSLLSEVEGSVSGSLGRRLLNFLGRS